MDPTTSGSKSDQYNEQTNFNPIKDPLNYVYNTSDSLDSLCNQNPEMHTLEYTNTSNPHHAQIRNSTADFDTINLNQNMDYLMKNNSFGTTCTPCINHSKNKTHNQSEPAFLKRSLNSTYSSLKKEKNIDESITLAVSQMNLCDVPLKRQILEKLSNTDPVGDGESNKSPNFLEFMKIEKSPSFYELEHEKLEELKEACTLLRNPYEQIVNTNTNRLPDAIQVTETVIRRLIKMCNKLTSFNRLNQADKIALLKGSIIEMFCIRATTNFNSENNFWYFVDDQNKGLSLVSMEILTTAQINFMSHKEFAIKYQSQFRNDSMIANLLTAIILFRPARASVSNPDIIKEEFLNYCYLLRRYLQVKHKGDSCVAKSSFLTLMHRLEELYHLSEDIVRIYSDMNPENVGQLFVELFDLS